MTSHEIRRHFLDFFRSKDHLIVPSAPLVAKNDPTLMFNNSGMAQFKDFFLGNGTPPSKRVADTQKCLRVSGKHNDLEDVGFDTYHHTMFEMLGNWSFGDYFKKEAIEWAWELLTEVYKLPKDRLYVSVFQGDERDGVPFDQEAFDLWKPIVGEDRIIYGNKKDNFWEMGDTGPCGPCSEIHVDLRPQADVDQQPGKELVNADHPQVVEIWNLVFMQFNRKADGSLEPLPARHVDTGMGFERLCMAIQSKLSNYDTDVFTGTIRVIEELSGRSYDAKMKASDGTSDEEQRMTAVAMRVIADHIRAVSFAIADGLVPSNAKAGYVIRRILRRAIRYGYSYLNLTEPFMTKLVPTLAMQFADVFPELNAQRDFVATVIREEEIAFLRTLGTGLGRLDQIIGQLTSEGKATIPGDTVFELNDTFGFPADLTALIAREKGLTIDEEGFQKALAEQKARSRKDAASSAGDWIGVNDEGQASVFVGYDQTETTTRIVKYRKVQNKQGTQYQIVLAETPFYAESGGQIGDVGTLTLRLGSQDLVTLDVVDTKKENDLAIHLVSPKPIPTLAYYAAGDNSFSRSETLGDDEEQLEQLLKLSDTVVAKIDSERRMLTCSNHSATHLLHAALREVLGTHVAQKGSYVGPDALRFDFSHFQKVTDEQLAEVERIVNEKIREDIKLDEKRNVPIEDAKNMGATALFGEKYGDFVRVITFDPNYSVELCGGTHVPSTGHIGLFKFTSEGSVSTGVRRVEAKTALGAEALVNEQFATVNELKELLKAPKDLVKAVQSLLEERSALQKQVEALQNEKVQQLKNQLLDKIEAVNGHSVLVEKVDVPSADALKQLAYDLKAKVDNLALVLGADINGKPQLAVMLPDELIKGKGLNAGQVVKELARNIKGGGGGQPFFATAGGSDASGLDAALAQGKQLLAQ
ncbi:alanine--tRNA ligase [Fibrisoma montanum]|uniref:Alanine--tRNA ligase n=1 Tax=Fibrisoma montanum TaxID=2305895 RepID=A0A418MEI2_9BACT|nr:alanine--tRNA ligase [Fibrisoma montanum]RIV25208.1 alanine--tRNA ligase [Fibrisoma montanum]